jgi:hypothetical protein
VSVIYCTIASGPCQSSHSWVEVPQNSRPYFTVSFETPQRGGPCPRTYIPQEQGGPVIPPGTGFPFCGLLRLTGPGFDSRALPGKKKKLMGLERGPLSLVGTTEELLDRKVAAPV